MPRATSHTVGNALKLFVTTFRDAMLMRPKNVYVLWAELFPPMLVDERTKEPIPERNLKAQASKYARKSREDLCGRLPAADGAHGHKGGACDTLARVGSVFPRKASGEEGLMVLELEAQFLDAWRLSGCDSSRLLEAFQENCALGVLFGEGFLEEFLRRLRVDFPGAGTDDVEEYQREVRGLPQLLDHGTPLGMEACKKVLYDTVIVFVTGALAGPRSYVGDLGYTLPGSLKTPAMRRPARRAVPAEQYAQLVAVVALDERGRRVCTQSALPVRVDRDQTLLLGRDRRWVQAHGAGVVSGYELVSRRHAMLCWRADWRQWVIEDVGQDGGGSTYGTLVVHASGGREFLRGSSAAVRHGDLVCLAPRDAGDDEHELVVGRKDVVYRFEVSS